MLEVSGPVTVSGSEAVTTIQKGKGVFFNFILVSEDFDPPHEKHFYNSSMWVPNEELEKWTALIKPGNVFYMRHAEWHSPKREGFKYPIAVLRINRYMLRYMTKPYWLGK